MSLSTPTTKQISDNIIAQLEAAFGQTVPLFAKAFIRVLSTVLGGVFVLLYKYAGFIFLQMFVQTASAKDTTVLGELINPLKFWGRLIGVGEPVAATNAELTIDITVEVQTGSIDSGTQLINTSNGVTYITAGSVALSAATVSATILAASDQNGGGGAGIIGNLDPGAIVSFANPLPNVARNAVVTAQTVTGADAETTGAYRQRIIDRFQQRPQGGAYSDYRAWGEETAGIINVYPYTSDCPGQVDLYCEATVASSGDPDGIPTAAQLQAVLDSVELDQSGLATRRPAGALVNSFGITRIGFSVEVIGLVVNDTAGVRAAIISGVEDYFLQKEPYIIGLSIPPRLDRITNSGVAGTVDDIVNSAAGIFTRVVVSLDGINIDTYTLGIGEKAKVKEVLFV